MGTFTERLARRTRTGPDLLGGILALANAHGVINFSGGFPEPSLFPTDVLGDIARRLIDEDPQVALQYAPSEGIASTREAIAGRIEATDGHRPHDRELLVTSGGIDAVTLIAKSMLDAGDLVLVEEPSYLGAVSGFTAFDPVLKGVPIDDEGLDIDALKRVIAQHKTPKLLYTIPDFQNPSGLSMANDRRQALVDLCREHGILIVEDVAYSQLGFDDIARPSLWSLGPDVVVQIGTFSKIFFPGVRLGWAAGPAEVIAPMGVAKQNSDQCAGALGQRMLEEYLRAGLLERDLPHARELYRSRAARITKALEEHANGLATWTVPGGGFFTWLRVPGVDTVALARETDVAFVPGAGFFAERQDTEHLRLSYSRISEDDIDTGIARLAAAIRAH
ncbi:PLP-dependent aminotransferase family protein [Actinocrispum sp. NPDC049592]|uniref:aminotransferase-like domain-containing protein n=1 Tax=Actinocrispum sp. NPDC049592 TaxID=3154835 RepID=UPI00342C1D24